MSSVVAARENRAAVEARFPPSFRRRAFVRSGFVAAVAALAVARPWASSGAPVPVEPGFEVELVADGFDRPTAMAFVPDGRILVAEKSGAVRVVKNGAVLPTPFIQLTDVNIYGDRGLHGIVLDPDFSENGYVYLLYTYENTPGVASGKAPYMSGQGTYAVALWETQIQVGASTALTYAAGNKLYASVNGLLTNRVQDAYEWNVSMQQDRDFVTVVGVVKVAPDANNDLMVLDLRI